MWQMSLACVICILLMALGVQQHADHGPDPNRYWNTQDAVLRAELKSFVTTIDEEIHKLDARIEVLAADLRSVQEALVGNGRVALPACSTTAPWNLLTVCQYWRNIALSLPCLWSSFDIQRDRGPTLIQSPPIGAGARAIQLEVIKHLSLSGDEPLNFVVEASETTLSQITLAELIGQSSRWKDVSLIGRGDLYAAFPNFGAGSLEILQSILQKFANARRLTCLTFSVSSSLTFSNPSAIAFPWSQLTYLKVINMPPQSTTLAHPGCYRLLEACPLLQTFVDYTSLSSWSVAGSENFALPPGTPILNHKVRILGLNQPAVLAHLQCPNVRHLSLPRITSQESASVVADFCRRSSCTELKKVEATFTDMSSSYFTIILVALSFVETLSIRVTSSRTMELCTSIIEYITVTPDAVPRLRCLKLGICDRAVWASNSEGNTKLVKHLACGVKKSAFRRVHIDIMGDMSEKESDRAKLASFESTLRNSTLSSSQLTIVNSLTPRKP
ncbi:hypothetical protein BDZ89DRAFT_1069929 [Hymenopellis radicata]|nr:hypothetical protein BDZ89DRAFT_1069929 [Hymenopellis radicata]